MAATNKKFRVLVVDDSTFMRKVLEGIFNADEQLQVVGNAKDGREAVAMAESLKPDVITMDINMPHVDGLQATAEIMTTNPKPIVIVSSESREGAARTIERPSRADFRIGPALPGCRTRGVHRRTSYRNAHCSGFYRRLPGRGNSRSAHAGLIHDPICRSAR